MILAIDQRDVNRCLGETTGCVQASKTAAYDYDSSCTLVRHLAVFSLTSIRFTTMSKDSATSIPASVTTSWVSFVMPSIADLIFIGVVAVLLFTPVASRLLGDAGTGWHIRTGEQILTTHAVPRTDPFS